MATDPTGVFIVTAAGWVYTPRYLSQVVADDRFQIGGIASVPPHAGAEDRLAYALEWVEAFGVRATLDHVAHSTAFATLDRYARLTGRGQPRSAATLAHRQGIPHRAASDVNSVSLRDFASETSPDILVSIAAPQRFDLETLSVAPAAVNVHASLLPDHRGVMPAFWALRAGDDVTGVTVHHMNEALDEGAVVARESMPIEADVSLHGLNMRLAEVGSTILLESLVALREDPTTGTAVDPNEGSYHSLPERADVRAFRHAGHSLY